MTAARKVNCTCFIILIIEYSYLLHASAQAPCNHSMPSLAICSGVSVMVGHGYIPEQHRYRTASLPLLQLSKRGAHVWVDNSELRGAGGVLAPAQC